MSKARPNAINSTVHARLEFCARQIDRLKARSLGLLCRPIASAEGSRATPYTWNPPEPSMRVWNSAHGRSIAWNGCFHHVFSEWFGAYDEDHKRVGREKKHHRHVTLLIQIVLHNCDLAVHSGTWFSFAKHLTESQNTDRAEFTYGRYHHECAFAFQKSGVTE